MLKNYLQDKDLQKNFGENVLKYFLQNHEVSKIVEMYDLEFNILALKANSGP